jgi:hypothetical protein
VCSGGRGIGKTTKKDFMSMTRYKHRAIDYRLACDVYEDHRETRKDSV